MVGFRNARVYVLEKCSCNLGRDPVLWVVCLKNSGQLFLDLKVDNGGAGIIEPF